MVEQAEPDNVYRAARRFAPKTQRKRLQLRTPEGHLQTIEEEFQDIKQYFSDLYRGPAPAAQQDLRSNRPKSHRTPFSRQGNAFTFSSGGPVEGLDHPSRTMGHLPGCGRLAPRTYHLAQILVCQ